MPNVVDQNLGFWYNRVIVTTGDCNAQKLGRDDTAGTCA